MSKKRIGRRLETICRLHWRSGSSSIVIFMFSESVNQGSFLGYPLAYYMSARGSLLAFVILIFGLLTNGKIDDEHGYGGEREDD